MNRTNLIISYFRLSEKEKNELFLAKGTQQILKIGLFAVGNAHFAVVEDDGTVTAYGDNSKGQCNTKSWKNVRKVVAGNFHTAALTNDGKVYATGDNTFGQCNVRQWSGVTELFADRNLTVGVKSDGKLLKLLKSLRAMRIQSTENSVTRSSTEKSESEITSAQRIPLLFPRRFVIWLCIQSVPTHL